MIVYEPIQYNTTPCPIHYVTKRTRPNEIYTGDNTKNGHMLPTGQRYAQQAVIFCHVMCTGKKL